MTFSLQHKSTPRVHMYYQDKVKLDRHCLYITCGMTTPYNDDAVTLIIGYT